MAADLNHASSIRVRKGEPSLAELFLAFLKLGAVGFGGPFALLSLLENEIVKRRGWLTPEQYTEAVAVGQLTPGPVFSSAAFYSGYRLRGIAGAFAVFAGAHLPGFFIALGIAALYVQFRDLPWIAGASRGIGAAVIGLLLAVTFRTGRGVIRDWRGASIATAAFLAVALARVDPILVIVAAGMVGILMYKGRPQTKA